MLLNPNLGYHSQTLTLPITHKITTDTSNWDEGNNDVPIKRFTPTTLGF
jgi:hypothetical protein